MREREGGRTIAQPVEAVDADIVESIIYDQVEPGSTVYTDEASAYKGILGPLLMRETVNHSAREFVRDGVSTNSIESVWAVLKRGLHGVYHHASDKHLHRYVDEFTFRLNGGNVERHTLQRLESFVDGTAGKRLTYKDLIG